MGYQFIHVSVYGRSAGKGKEGGHSVRSIMAEAGREQGAHPHVEAPQEPILLFGCSLAEVEAKANEWAEQARDTIGRRLRRDGICLLAGTVSAPPDMTDEAWDAMKRDAIAELAKDGRLLSVVEHADEPHQPPFEHITHRHLHFYKVPELGKTFETIHLGRAASAAAKADGAPKGEQNKAYKKAMRGFQDDFYAQVGWKHGLTRIGPAKRRLTRSEWKAEQIAAKALAEARAKAESSLVDATAMTQRAEAAAKAALAEADKVAAKVAEVAAVREQAKAEADRADKARKAAKATAERVAREKTTMARVADQVKADRAAIATARRRGGVLGQMWGGFVDFVARKKQKAEQERQAERDAHAAKLAEVKAEAKRERERADEAETSATYAKRDLELARQAHRKALGQSEAERVRVEMALAKHLAPTTYKQPTRGQRM